MRGIDGVPADRTATPVPGGAQGLIPTSRCRHDLHRLGAEQGRPQTKDLLASGKPIDGI